MLASRSFGVARWVGGDQLRVTGKTLRSLSSNGHHVWNIMQSFILLSESCQCLLFVLLKTESACKRPLHTYCMVGWCIIMASPINHVCNQMKVLRPRASDYWSVLPTIDRRCIIIISSSWRGPDLSSCVLCGFYPAVLWGEVVFIGEE